MDQQQWFGAKPFANVCLHTEKAETPVGRPCSWCGEAFVPEDDGLIIPGSGEPHPYHHCCFMRQVVGSVGHQLQRCPCYGGTVEDPADMTLRQAAQEAVRVYESNHGGSDGYRQTTHMR